MIDIKTGDIALSAGAGLFGRLIRKFTRSTVNHAMTLVCLADGKVVKRHAARGWSFHQSYVEEPFPLDDPTTVMIRRVRPEVFMDSFSYARAQELMDRRSASLIGSPYDWLAIMDVFNDGIFGERIGGLLRMNSARRVMCSEAAAWIADPEGMYGIAIDPERTNLLTADPKKPFHKTTPADIATAPWLETVWERS